MSDRDQRCALRGAVGQPACARALVAAGRAKLAKGLRVELSYPCFARVFVVSACYPLRDGSGWFVLFGSALGVRVEDRSILRVVV
ncbi:hypothetical protein LCGC14_0273830 [marine sediment metagenome]|uniref:Uncharacterized protein n=2 Tax=root TaxID=1 RepID=A0A9C9NI42_9HYPH|nr:hypothetical protein [Aurantimonas coralicida]